MVAYDRAIRHKLTKLRSLFADKFFDDNRYRLGKVGRFRINRKFDMEVPEDIMHLRPDDFIAVIEYILDLRARKENAHIDDIDHLAIVAYVRWTNSLSKKCVRGS